MPTRSFKVHKGAIYVLIYQHKLDVPKLPEMCRRDYKVKFNYLVIRFLKEPHVLIVFLGVDKNELNAIATDYQHVLDVRGYADLSVLIPKVLALICQ